MLTFSAILVNETLDQATPASEGMKEDGTVVASKQRDREPDGGSGPSVTIITTAADFFETICEGTKASNTLFQRVI